MFCDIQDNQTGAKRVAHQIPEGLVRYAMPISDIETSMEADSVIMDDVTWYVVYR
jgi:diphthamide synthase subunit DPH2